MNILVVATFNVRNARALDGRNSWVARRRSTVAAIASLEADVIGLQEVFAHASRYVLGRLGGYEAHGKGRGRGSRGEHCPVLTRRDVLEVVSSSTRWFGETPDTPGTRLPGASFPRIATLVRLRAHIGGPEMEVWNVHLDEHLPHNRIRSTEQLASWLAQDVPTVVMGDFNATSDDAGVFAPLRRAGLTSAAGPGLGGTAHNFTGRVDGPRIDHVLVSDHWQVEYAEVLTTRATRLPSDHWPLRAVLRASGR